METLSDKVFNICSQAVISRSIESNNWIVQCPHTVWHVEVDQLRPGYLPGTLLRSFKDKHVPYN